MVRQIIAAIRMVVACTILCGLAYPLVVTGAASIAFPAKADGSIIERDGKPVGSQLIGQPFDGPQWFHPRPSAAGDGYDPTASSASNLGPRNAELLKAVAQRVRTYRAENGLAPTTPVPVDAVTASGSGLDPDISVANARIQARRVAAARHLSVAHVRVLIDAATSRAGWGVFGNDRVNVLALNLALRAQR